MKNNLAENIRKFRKERGLTQEQLAEVFNMTVGAVHKWEAGLSTPDITVLMELADFFDTSLDVLVGYNVRDNRVDVLCKRLRKMTDTMDPEGPDEAEKALISGAADGDQPLHDGGGSAGDGDGQRNEALPRFCLRSPVRRVPDPQRRRGRRRGRLPAGGGNGGTGGDDRLRRADDPARGAAFLRLRTYCLHCKHYY